MSWSLLKQSRQICRTHNTISADDWVIHFTSLLYDENASSLNFHIPPTIADDDFDLDLPFTIEEIQNAINNLASNKSPGPDGIPSEFLKYTSHEITPLLLSIFNTIIESGIFPSNWGKTVICTIYKNGQINNPGNYRGISITDTLYKIFSTIVNKRLYN